jgi:hypothetical protein
MRRGKKDPPIANEEVAARRLPHTGRDSAHVATVGIHHELLVATPAATCRLEDDALSVVAEIRLGVLASEGELSDVAKVRLVRIAEGDQSEGRRPSKDDGLR